MSDIHPRIFHQKTKKRNEKPEPTIHRNAASVIVRATRLQHTTLINSQPEGQRSQELERSFDLGKVTARSSAAPEDKLQFELNSDRFEIGSSQVLFLAVLIEHGKETNAVQSVGPEIVKVDLSSLKVSVPLDHCWSFYVPKNTCYNFLSESIKRVCS